MGWAGDRLGGGDYRDGVRARETDAGWGRVKPSHLFPPQIRKGEPSVDFKLNPARRSELSHQ